MSGYGKIVPTATYEAPEKPYYVSVYEPYVGPSPVFSTITVAGEINDTLPGGGEFVVNGAAGGVGMDVISVAEANTITQKVTNVDGDELGQIVTTIADDGTNVATTFITYPGGIGQINAQIEYFESINGGDGGVVITGGNAEAVTVANGKVEITDAVLAASNANLSTLTTYNIQGVSSINTSNIVADTIFGNIGQISSLVGISSINGNPYNAPGSFTQFVNSNASITVSTVANATTSVPIAAFSTVAGHYYRATVEFASVNMGGGVATDSACLAMDSDVTGLAEVLDTWTVDQTQVPAPGQGGYYATASGIMEAGGSNIAIVTFNNSGGANVQNVTTFRGWAEDLGIPTNQFV